MRPSGRCTRGSPAPPSNSPPQRNLSTSTTRSTVRSTRLPALLPEVWLHWDPRTVRERGAAALLGHAWTPSPAAHGQRVILEVDGSHHYASPDGTRPAPPRYAALARADRELKLQRVRGVPFRRHRVEGPGSPAACSRRSSLTCSAGSASAPEPGRSTAVAAPWRRNAPGTHRESSIKCYSILHRGERSCARAGRSLELLVQALEHLLAGAPSRDPVARFHHGGELGTSREVDVSLRSQVGSVQRPCIMNAGTGQSPRMSPGSSSSSKRGTWARTRPWPCPPAASRRCRNLARSTAG